MTARVDEERVRAALGGPELAWLWPAVAGRIERFGRVGGAVPMAGRSTAERFALNAVLRERPLRLDASSVSVGVLDDALMRSPLAVGAREAAEIVLGRRLRDLAVERAEMRTARAAMWENASAHAALQRHPLLAGWLDHVRRTGRLTRRAPGREERLLGDALDVLAQLPTDEPRLLSALAAEIGGGDNHMLDDGSPVGSLVLSALGHLAGVRPNTAAVRRDLWSRMGVLRDNLSSQVFGLNLRAGGTGLLVDVLRAGAAAGEPVVVTLSMLERWLGSTQWPPDDVFVCENPQVMTAIAARLGAHSAPLVCVSGNLSIAATRLLRTLSDAGVRLHVHADFDPGGLAIAGAVLRLAGARPWRYTEADYIRALEAGLGGDEIDRDVRLRGSPLAAAIAVRRVAVYEESVVDDLATDLARLSRPAWLEDPVA